jgi:sugar phosphate isomerase/epimerase
MRNRREFLRDGAALVAGVAVASNPLSLVASKAAKAAKPKVAWTVGCFNRPWAKWAFSETVTAVKAAGYGTTGLLTRTKMDPFISPDATGDYLWALKSGLVASGISANMGALSSRHDIPIEETILSLKTQIDNAAYLGLKTVLSFGTDKPEHFEHYFRSMAAAAAHAESRGIELAMKPHGGSSGASEEIIAGIKKVGHPNFKIWYDAGNIIYYTGKDPIEELKPIVQYVTGFCAKDCGQPKGDVMIQFGTGKVDFRGVFSVLKDAGFKGPIMVEGVAPAETPDAIAANAKANREFLEKVIASL